MMLLLDMDAAGSLANGALEWNRLAGKLLHCTVTTAAGMRATLPKIPGLD